MAQTGERNKKRILDHLPSAIEQLRALTEMIERDAKR
jgi:adenylate kinase family enzyme